MHLLVLFLVIYSIYMGVYFLDIKYVCTVCLILIKFHPLTILTLTSKGLPYTTTETLEKRITFVVISVHQTE